MKPTTTRGSRIASTAVPRNMRENMRRDEARAWSHSTLAGILWELGFRASRAVKIASSQLSASPMTHDPESKIVLRLPTAQKARYVRASSAAGLTLSAWIFQQLDRASEPLPEKSADDPRPGIDQSPADLPRSR